MECKKFNSKNGNCKGKRSKCPFANGSTSAQYVCKDFTTDGIKVNTDIVSWANGKPVKYQSFAVINGKLFASEPRMSEQNAVENLRVTARDWITAAKKLIAHIKEQNELTEENKD